MKRKPYRYVKDVMKQRQNKKNIRLQRQNQRDYNHFIKSQAELVTVKSIDPLSIRAAESLYSVPGSPFKMKRNSSSNKYTVVLSVPLPTILVQDLIKKALNQRVKNAKQTKGENLD